MAGNMDENEIKAVSDAMDELRRTGSLSAESLAKLSGSSDTVKKSLEKFNQEAMALGRTFASATGAIHRGEGSFNSLGSAIGGLTNIVGKLAGSLPLIGGAAKALAEGVGEAAKFVLGQLDIMAQNYQTLGDASAGAVDGIDGLKRQFDVMGNYSLPAFTKAVKANMAGLTAFKGTAAEGAEELSKISGALTTGQTAQRFLKLGISLDGVGDAAANYTATFGRIGATQGRTTDELTKKTEKYIYEVDQIARITGQSREAQQRAQQQTMADARARAMLGEMTANGQKDAAEQLTQLMSAFDEATNASIRASVTGIPLTEQAQKASVFTQNAIIETVNAVKSGVMTATEGAAAIREALASGATRFRGLTKYAGDTFGNLTVAGEDAAATLAMVAELKTKKEYAGLSDAELVKKAQELQTTASGKLTNDFTKAQLAVADTNKNLQSLGFTLAIAAVPAVAVFAEGLKKVTDFIDEKFGRAKTQDDKNFQAMDWWEKSVSTLARGIEGVGALVAPGWAERAEKARIEFETKRQKEREQRESKTAGTAVPAEAGVRSDRAQREREEQARRTVAPTEARTKAEQYYGKAITEDEYSALIKATHAEAAAGKQSSQTEQAMIMASILNRARTDRGGILGALMAKNQFQSVTGTAANQNQPSKQFLTGPDRERLKSIEGATDLLEAISKEQKNFTAAATGAYGPGTNISYRDRMLAAGGSIVGGTVFQTAPPEPVSKTAKVEAPTPAAPSGGYQPRVAQVSPDKTLPESRARDAAVAALGETNEAARKYNTTLAGLEQMPGLLQELNMKIDNLTYYTQIIASSNQKIQKQTS